MLFVVRLRNTLRGCITMCSFETDVCNECGFYLWDADSVPLNNCNSCEREVNNV